MPYDPSVWTLPFISWTAFLEWMFPYGGWRFAAIAFYLIAGWQNLQVLTLTNPVIASATAIGLQETPTRTRALMYGYVLVWLPVVVGGALLLTLVGWLDRRKKEQTG